MPWIGNFLDHFLIIGTIWEWELPCQGCDCQAEEYLQANPRIHWEVLPEELWGAGLWASFLTPTPHTHMSRVLVSSRGSQEWREARRLSYHFFTICCLLSSWPLASVSPHPHSSFILNYCKFHFSYRSSFWFVVTFCCFLISLKPGP
jgi:hypothetical protein